MPDSSNEIYAFEVICQKMKIKNVGALHKQIIILSFNFTLDILTFKCIFFSFYIHFPNIFSIKSKNILWMYLCSAGSISKKNSELSFHDLIMQKRTPERTNAHLSSFFFTPSFSSLIEKTITSFHDSLPIGTNTLWIIYCYLFEDKF